MQKGMIHSVETFGTLDGPGIRYVLFLKGCPLRCVYCHNPDTWEMQGGTLKTSEEVIEDIIRYRNFYKKGGVTLSGGEPMLQHDFCAELLDGLKVQGMHTALDTAGSIPLTTSKDLIDRADMLLLDIKAPNGILFENITGNKIDNTLDTLNYCESIGKRLWIRHVIIPGFTDTDEVAYEMIDLLKDKTCVEHIDLLPFHKMGEYKWHDLGLPYTLDDVCEPPLDRIERLCQIYAEGGLKARYNH